MAIRIITGMPDPLTRGAVCAMGGFDGVHRGHQALLKRARELAGGRTNAGVITFDPLPIFVLKAKDIFYLTPRREKERILEECGIDFVFYIKFTREFAGLDPRAFVAYLRDTAAPSHVIVGDNFRFGRDRAGSAGTFGMIAAGTFGVETVPEVADEGTISSTRIRELLLLGNVGAANRLLGREYAIHGNVIRGKGKGTHLGFPTINIRVEGEKLLPLDGVYSVRVELDREVHRGGMFCRHGEVEVHILNFSGDLYDRPVTVKLHERIRDIRHFANDAALKTAIAHDIQDVSEEKNSQ